MGFDVHQLEQNREFFMGGIKLPSDKGAVGHSDADVLIHAICDALLGAADAPAPTEGEHLRMLGIDKLKAASTPRCRSSRSTASR